MYLSSQQITVGSLALTALCLLLFLPPTHAQTPTPESAGLRLDSLLVRAKQLANTRDLAEALTINKAAEELALTVWGQTSEAFSRCTANRGYLFLVNNRVEEALQSYSEAKALREILPGGQDRIYANILNNLALLYEQKSAYPIALTLHRAARDLRASIFGNTSVEYAASLVNLSNIYYDLNRNAEAAPLLLEAKAIIGQKQGNKHPAYATILMNLANVYTALRQFSAVEALYLEAKDIQAQTVGKEHPDYALCLKNLGLLADRLQRPAQAEALLLESENIEAAALGNSHPEYLRTRYYRALGYTKTKRYPAAEALLIEVKTTLENTGAQTHPLYLENHFALARLYLSQHRYPEAEDCLRQTIQIAETTRGKESTDYAHALFDLAQLHWEQKRFAVATQVFQQWDNANTRYLDYLLPFLSEKDQQAFEGGYTSRYNALYAFALAAPSPANACLIFDHTLRHKGHLLQNSQYLNLWLETKGDSLQQKWYADWKARRAQLAYLYSQALAERLLATDSLERVANTLETQLARSVAPFRENRQHIGWQQVRQHLKAGEAALELVHFQYYSSAERTDSVVYAALLLRPGDTAPLYLPLFEAQALQLLLQAAGTGDNFLKINKLYTYNNDRNAPKNLYDLIWKPLEPHLKGVKTIYCAASGLLHRLNLGAISLPNQQVLADRYQLLMLGSTRQLAQDTPTDPPTYRPLAYLAGGIRYDSDSAALDYATRSRSYRSPAWPESPAFEPDSSAQRNNSLHFLPATAAEVRTIGHLLTEAQWSATIDTGYFATEESFRALGQLLPAPRLLHLATHGYFFPSPGDPASPAKAGPFLKNATHPLLRSGLLLAGAKTSWLNGKPPKSRLDGILTAYEIGQMNLRNTELVVLSACETGLGDISDDEGVFGLQRAFKMAGAKYLLLSLWKVDDQTTKTFMLLFYQHWLSGKKTIPEAFRTAQRDLRRQYPGAYDWAGFVLLE